MVKSKSKIDTYSYKGWLNSDKLIKRSFAVLGHQIIATLVIYGIILGIFLIVLIIAAVIKLLFT